MKGREEVGTPKLREAVLNPPDELSIGVGKIIVHWSFQVWLLQKITYALLGVSDKQGRVAVRDPRPEEYIPMIQQLMDIGGLTTTVKMSELMEDLRAIKTLRDSIAHGVWIKNLETGRLLIQMVSGNWQLESKGKKTSRKVIPEARGVDRNGLESIRMGIEDTIRATQLLLEQVEEQLKASREKSHTQSP